MLIKTVLNRIHRFKGFVYGAIRLDGRAGCLAILIEVIPRSNSRPVCSGCGKSRPGYDTLPERSFAFIPLWGIPVYLFYSMRRVECCTCGIVVESVPWADGKHQLTNAYAWFLARWAKRLSWKEVGEVFKTSWDTVFRSVERAVEWGLAHRTLEGITALGVDEIAIRRGHKYLTVVYDIGSECRRLIWIGETRTKQALERFFDFFGTERISQLQYICSDMAKGYLEAIKDRARSALNVLDRYHIVALLNQKIDKVRAEEVKRLKSQGEDPVLSHSRWCFLKRPENLTEKQDQKLADLLRLNLRTVRAYLLKDDFDTFWHYHSPAWAEKFVDGWCRRVMRSRIEPMKEFATTLRGHMPLLMNWFKARNDGISLGAVEGLNNKAKVTTRKSYGFRTYRVAQIALYHALGELPEPKLAHEFC